MLEVVGSANIVTFADKSRSGCHRRFRAQARSLNVFEQIFTLTEDDLEPAFRARFGSVLTTEVRGFGYWVWKPQVILQALRGMCPGDFLVYLDSGSHLSHPGKARLTEYLVSAQSSELGIVGFQTDFPERQYTKKDLINYFGVDGQPNILETGQVQAGAIVIHKREQTDAFFHSWLEVFETDMTLVDDTESNSQNDDSFIEHRHDQSVFSLLSKMCGATLLSAAEQFPYTPSSSWSQLRHEPFHHRRDTLSRSQRFWREALRPFLKVRLMLYVWFRRWALAVKNSSGRGSSPS